MAQVAIRRTDARSKALLEVIAELVRLDEPRKRLVAEIASLHVHYDLGAGHPLLGRRMPDLDLITADGLQRVFALLHDARPMLLNLGAPGRLDVAGWADRVSIDRRTSTLGVELPALGSVAAPSAVLIRLDGRRRVGGRRQSGPACRCPDYLVRPNDSVTQ